METTIELKYEGIDDWNRPVFKDVNSNNRFGDVNNLFSYSEVEEEHPRWLDFKHAIEDDANSYLEYFGKSFGCEPYGGLSDDVLLIVNF